MMEAGVLVGLNEDELFWHLPKGRTSGSLPDNRDLWDIIWSNRLIVQGFAHSHPGSGRPGPSQEDLSTFAAVESALGRRLKWWITSSDTMVSLRRRHVGPGYSLSLMSREEEPPWAARLREESGYA